MVKTQSKEMEANLSHSVNRISMGAKPKSHPPPTSFRPNTHYKCYRCGRTGHTGKDPKCPARDKKCNKCENVGHFANSCRTKTDKHDKPRKSLTYAKKGYANHKKDFVRQVDSDDEYAVSIGQTEKTEIKIGGNPVDVIIDSGATVNIIDNSLWEVLKKKKVKCRSQKTDKKLFAYGSDEPLELAGVFKAKNKL